MSKQVAVVGATGVQGGSVARELAQEPDKWKVVALTRDPDSAKAQELKKIGAQLCKCDLAKPDEVAACVKGSYAVFGVTDFWTSGMKKENEVQQGRSIVDASKKAGVQHLVLSTLDDTSKISGGKRHVEHFDSKAEVAEYAKKSGVPATFVQPSCYYENFKNMVRANPQSGQLEFTLPVPGDSKIAMFSVGETGYVVREVLNNRSKYLGKTVAMTGDWITPNEIATTLSKQFGKPVKFNSVPESVFSAFPIPGAAELSNMFNFFHEYGYFGEKVDKSRDIWEGKKAVPKLSSFGQWAKDWKL